MKRALPLFLLLIPVLSIPAFAQVDLSGEWFPVAHEDREVDRRGLTHADVAARAGLSRSAVTGILSGSLQKVTIDRVLRLLEAVGLEASVRVRRAA